MNDSLRAQTLTTLDFDISKEPIPADPSANPFKLVVDPAMRVRLRKALFDLVESHDVELARYVGEGSLALDSYKEYIELFAHSLTAESDVVNGAATFAISSAMTLATSAG